MPWLAPYSTWECQPTNHKLVLGPKIVIISSLSVCVAPSGPPTSVHVVVLNHSAVEVQWNLPLANLRNGVIRGFKIVYQENEDTTEQVVDVDDGTANEYIVSGLKAATVYTFSVLAYISSDGPRSIHLTVSTFSEGQYSSIPCCICMWYMV